MGWGGWGRRFARIRRGMCAVPRCAAPIRRRRADGAMRTHARAQRKDEDVRPVRRRVDVRIELEEGVRAGVDCDVALPADSERTALCDAQRHPGQRRRQRRRHKVVAVAPRRHDLPEIRPLDPAGDPLVVDGAVVVSLNGTAVGRYKVRARVAIVRVAVGVDRRAHRRGHFGRLRLRHKVWLHANPWVVARQYERAVHRPPQPL